MSLHILEQIRYLHLGIKFVFITNLLRGRKQYIHRAVFHLVFLKETRNIEYSNYLREVSLIFDKEFSKVRL